MNALEDVRNERWIMAVNNITKLPYNIATLGQLQKLVEMILSTCTPSSIILFGSYSRLEQKCDSDIDILVLTKEKMPDNVKAELHADFDLQNADIVFYTEATFNESSCLFVNEVKRDGILLWKN